ncbi:MAG TPA: YceI family protein [Bacteriovoracaceae bacterium]|nr:YceI family protein [Bacteriovoracaceae bacterium]
MKKMLMLLSLLSLPAMAAEGKLEDGKYNIDPAHSRVSFEIDHFVISSVEGRFNDVKGTVEISRDLKKCNVNVTIPVASLDTAVQKRDEHLRSADFFDAKKFPNMTFKSKKCSGSLEDLKVTGDLTIKGVTKEVVMEAEYEGSVKDSWGNQRAAFTADFDIKRKDFNITYDDKIDIGPTVGDKVEVEIITELILEKPKK